MKTLKGESTKEKIISVSKKRFYNFGYKNTRISDIAADAGIIKGNISYYFAKKDDILKDIFRLFLDEVYNYVQQNSNYAKDENEQLYNFCRYTLILYRIIFSDKNNIRCYHEMIQNKSNYRVLNEFISCQYKDILSSLGISFDDDDYMIFLLSEFGSRREIILYFLEENFQIDTDKLISELIKNFCRFLQIPTEITNKLINDAFSFADSHNCKDIHFLV